MAFVCDEVWEGLGGWVGGETKVQGAGARVEDDHPSTSHTLLVHLGGRGTSAHSVDTPFM